MRSTRNSVGCNSQTGCPHLKNRTVIPDPLARPLTGDVEMKETRNELSFAKAWAHTITFSHPPQ